MAAACEPASAIERPRSGSGDERHLRPRPANGGDTLQRAERAAKARHLELEPETGTSVASACVGTEPKATSEPTERVEGQGNCPSKGRGALIVAAKRSVTNLFSRLQSSNRIQKRPLDFLRQQQEREDSSRSPEIGGSACSGLSDEIEVPVPENVEANSVKMETCIEFTQNHEIRTHAAQTSTAPSAQTSLPENSGDTSRALRMKLSLVRPSGDSVLPRKRKKRFHSDLSSLDGAKRVKSRGEKYKVKLVGNAPSLTNGDVPDSKVFADFAVQTDTLVHANSESQCTVSSHFAEAQATVSMVDCSAQASVVFKDADMQHFVEQREHACQVGTEPKCASVAVQTTASTSGVPTHCKREVIETVGSPQRRVAAAQSLLLLASTAQSDAATPPDSEGGVKIESEVKAGGVAVKTAAGGVQTICEDALFWKLANVCVDAAGGARSLHCDWRQVCTHYGTDHTGLSAFCRRFVAEGTREPRAAQPRYTIAVVADGAGSRHNCVGSMPKFADTLAHLYPKMPVKIGSLTSSRDTTTMTMADYHTKIGMTYSHGTYRYGPLEALSCVGRKREECGTIMDPVLDALEGHPIVTLLTPWGANSMCRHMHRNSSDDGPILWVRPGEQLIPVDEVPTPSDKSPYKLNPTGSGSSRASGGGRRAQGRRYVRFEDRTPCHADCVDNPRRTTAAVGLVQAVHAGQDKRSAERRPVKDVIVFDAASFEYLLNDLMIDIYEPPMNQAPHLWIDEAKLNELRRSGVRYTHTTLCDGDVYFLPRNTVHQFRSVSAVCSVAWHVRLKQYERTGAEQSVETLDVGWGAGGL